MAPELRPGGPIPTPRRVVLPHGEEVRPRGLLPWAVPEPRSHVSAPTPAPGRPFDWQHDDPDVC